MQTRPKARAVKVKSRPQQHVEEIADDSDMDMINVDSEADDDDVLEVVEEHDWAEHGEYATFSDQEAASAVISTVPAALSWKAEAEAKPENSLTWTERQLLGKVPNFEHLAGSAVVARNNLTLKAPPTQKASSVQSECNSMSIGVLPPASTMKAAPMKPPPPPPPPSTPGNPELNASSVWKSAANDTVVANIGASSKAPPGTASTPTAAPVAFPALWPVMPQMPQMQTVLPGPQAFAGLADLCQASTAVQVANAQATAAHAAAALLGCGGQTHPAFAALQALAAAAPANFNGSNAGASVPQLESAAKAIAAGPKKQQGDEYTVGSEVRYWSTSHKKWLSAKVEAIHRDVQGNITGYDLDTKNNAGAEKVMGGTVSANAPASTLGRGMLAPHVAKKLSGQTAKIAAKGPTTSQRRNKQAMPAPSLTDRKKIQLSKSGGNMVTDADEAVRVALGQSQGVSKSANAEKPNGKADLSPVKNARLVSQVFQPGNAVVYFSTSVRRWIPTIVMAVKTTSNGTRVYDLACKPGALPKYVRSTPAKLVEKRKTADSAPEKAQRTDPSVVKLRKIIKFNTGSIVDRPAKITSETKEPAAKRTRVSSPEKDVDKSEKRNMQEAPAEKDSTAKVSAEKDSQQIAARSNNASDPSSPARKTVTIESDALDAGEGKALKRVKDTSGKKSWGPPCFAVEERVRYWSSTVERWVKAVVKALSLAKETGHVVSYNLDVKAGVEPWRLAAKATPSGAPAPPEAMVGLTDGSKPPPEAEGKALRGAGGGGPVSESVPPPMPPPTRATVGGVRASALRRGEDGFR